MIFNNDLVSEYVLFSPSIKNNVIGKITSIFLETLNARYKDGYIKINIYHIYKVMYDNFTNKIEFKNIFYDDIVNIGNLNDKYQIILSFI